MKTRPSLCYILTIYSLIGQALNEGSLNIDSVTLKVWYKYLLGVNVMQSGKPGAGSRELVPCRVERLNPWKKSWRATSLPGLTSKMSSFLWKMFHDIPPTWAPPPFCVYFLTYTLLLFVTLQNNKYLNIFSRGSRAQHLASPALANICEHEEHD